PHLRPAVTRVAEDPDWDLRSPAPSEVHWRSAVHLWPGTVPTQSAVTAAPWALHVRAGRLSRLRIRLEDPEGSRRFRRRSCRVNLGAAFQVRYQLAYRFGPSSGSDHRCPWHAPTE